MARQLLVERGDAIADIDHPEDQARLADRRPRLIEDPRRNQLFVVRDDTPGVDDPKTLPQPLRLTIDPVARDSRQIADDRTA